MDSQNSPHDEPVKPGRVCRDRGSNTRVICLHRHFNNLWFCLKLAEKSKQQFEKASGEGSQSRQSGVVDGHLKSVRLVPQKPSQLGESSEELVKLLPELLTSNRLEETSNSEQCEDFEQLLEAVKESKERRGMQYRYEDHPPLTNQPSKHLNTLSEAVVGQIYGINASFGCTKKERPKPRPGLYIGQGLFLPFASFHLEKEENGKRVVSFQPLECVFKEETLYASQYLIPCFEDRDSQYTRVTIEPPLLMERSYIYAVEHEVPVEHIRRMHDLDNKNNRQNFNCQSKVGKEDYDRIIEIVMKDKNERLGVFRGVGQDGSGEGTRGGNGGGSGGGNGGGNIGNRGGGSGGGHCGGGSGGGNNRGGNNGGGNNGGGKGGGAKESRRSERREKGSRKREGGQGEWRQEGSEEEVERTEVEEIDGCEKVKTLHQSHGSSLVYELTEDLHDLDWSWDGSSPWLPICNLEAVNLPDIVEERSDNEKAKINHQSHSSSLVYELTEDLEDLNWNWDCLSPWLPICDVKTVDLPLTCATSDNEMVESPLDTTIDKLPKLSQAISDSELLRLSKEEFATWDSRWPPMSMESGPAKSVMINLEEPTAEQVQRSLFDISLFDLISQVHDVMPRVTFNMNQCRRIADRFSTIGEVLKSKTLHEGSHRSISHRLIKLIKRGKTLVQGYAESRDITSLVISRGDNQDAFTEIQEELDLEWGRLAFPRLPKVTHQDLQEDAAMDWTAMCAMNRSIIESYADHILKKRAQVVLEKTINLDDFGDALPSYLAIDRKSDIVIEQHLEEALILGKMSSKELWVNRCSGKWLGCDFAIETLEIPTYLKCSGCPVWNKEEMLKEARSLVALQHPYIVRTVGFGQDEESGLFVKELMDGDLKHFMMNGGHFEELDVVDVMYQIAKGMRYLHGRGIVQVDLMCSNILVKKLDYGVLQVKIGDCRGSRTLVERKLIAFEQVRKRIQLRWSAPEVLYNYNQEESIDSDEVFTYPSDGYCGSSKEPLWSRSDVYSFAMTCYEILTCKCPFDGIGEEDGLSQYIQEGRVEECNELPEKLDEDLKGMIRQCWRRDPSERPTFEEICLLLCSSTQIGSSSSQIESCSSTNIEMD